MYPRLFEIPEIFGIGPLTIYTYGVMLAAAYLAGLQLAIVRGRKAGLDAGRLLDLGVYIVIAALIGAKLLLLFVNFNYFRNNPEEILVLARSGGVFYGGLITATLVAFWYIRRHKLPFWTTCDMFAPGIALGHVIGRLGCLMAGCCYGRPTDVPWAITFTDPFAAANVGTPSERAAASDTGVRSGAELIILIFLLVTERKGRTYPGRTFWGYMLLYAVSRFVIEFYRADERGFVMGLSTSQFISVVLAPISLVMLFYLRRRPGARARQIGTARGLRGGTVSRDDLLVSADEAGVRIDRYLTGVLSGQSRSQIQRLIKDGKVTIAGQAVPAEPHRARRATRSRSKFPPRSAHVPQPEDHDLDIIYQDPMSSSSTSPPAWSCIPPPATRRARW